jgi:general secretion pathway protein F
MSPSARPDEGAGLLSFALTVRDAQGRVQQVTLRGRVPADAVRLASQQGWQVLSLDDTTSTKAVAMPRPFLTQRRTFPLLQFSQELLALLDAGLNLAEAMTTLCAKERQSSVRMLLDGILGALRQGKPLSDALSSTPWLCPPIYLAAVRASEQTGDLPQTLARYVAYQTQLEAIRKKLVSSAIYPVMLLMVGGFVTLFLLGYVVPRFSAVYDSAGRDMPWMSMQLLRFGRLIHAHWALTGLMVVAVLLTGVLSVMSLGGRAWWGHQVTRLPWLSQRVSEFRLARFFRAVSMLLASGIALPKALGMVADLLSVAQQRRLTQARRAIETGKSLSEALVQAGLCTPVAESLIKVGERTGQMAEMLERVARFQDEDFARWLDWTSKLLEPVLMTAMGLIIGLVVVLLYMPIFDLAGSLQ